MDLSPQFPAASRKDGWSPELKARFLALLAQSGNVRLCARRCGFSAQSAYVHRRRDPLFARGWDAAMELARPFCGDVLADRAIDGIEEEVWFKGELVGTRRRYDSRLLLAHLARLDARQGSKAARDDAGRFDELVAMIAGAEPPEAILDDDGLPASHVAHVERAVEDAESEAFEAVPALATREERDQAVFDAGDAAHDRADAEWRSWFAQVCEIVDRLEANGGEDGVNPSTSQPIPPRHGEELAAALQDSVNGSTSAENGTPAGS